MTDTATICQASAAVLFAPDKATVCQAHVAVLLAAETPTHITYSVGSLLGPVSPFVSGPVEFSLSTSSLLGPISSFTSPAVEITSSASFLLGSITATTSGAVEINTAVTGLLGQVSATAFSPVEQNVLVSSLLGVASFSVSPDVEINVAVSDLFGHVNASVSPDREIVVDLTSLLGSITTYILGANSDYDNRVFLNGYTFDGTTISFPIAALPGLTAEHAAQGTGDIREFIRCWDKRVLAWSLTRTYIDLNLMSMPQDIFDPQSTAYPTSLQERYTLITYTNEFASYDWSGREPASLSDMNKWRIENLFPGWVCDGTNIYIPLYDIIGLTEKEADGLAGDVHALIIAVAHNLYDWQRKFPFTVETVRVDPPIEVYDQTKNKWWSKFYHYIYVEKYGSLSLGELPGE